MPDENQQSKEAAKALLLAEYARFAESFWQNETSGETRVNWFIGIVTAAMGGLLALAAKSAGTPFQNQARLIVLAGLSAVLVLGIFTLARMISRNEKTDQYKRALDIIRQKFQDSFDTDEVLVEYYPAGGPWKYKSPKRKLGGLAHIVAAINSLAIAVGCGVFLYPYFKQRQQLGPAFVREIWLLYLVAAFMLALSFAVQYATVSGLEKEAKKRLYEKDPRHAGGVVFQLGAGGKVEYLLVHPYRDQTEEEKTARKKKEIDLGKWVLPKGKVEIGESHGDAALREVREEAAVRGRIVCPLGLSAYQIKDQEIRVKFYLMEKLLEVKTKETRGATWFEFSLAKGMLTHEESKEILEWAELCREGKGKGQA